jgi:Mg2+/Co2+ transporter CorB
MDLSLLVPLAVILLCFMLSGFFSGSETAFTASSRARVHTLQQSGDSRATIVNRLLSSRERLIGGILIGNNIVNTGAAALSTGVLLSIFGDAGILYATIIVSVLVIIFCEILPKTIALNQPERMALIASRPLSAVVAVFGPMIIAVEAIVRTTLRLMRMKDRGVRDILSGVEELRGQVDLLHREGEVEKAQRDMLSGLLDLEELLVEDVMIHRTEMRTINADLPPGQIVTQVLQLPNTRIPLWRDTPENIIGVVHARDLLRELHAAGNNPGTIHIESIARAPWFVPDLTSVRAQLRAFLARKEHFALVVDEYGEVQGLVTLEDILEEIVGDIQDEHDIVATALRPHDDGAMVVDGATPIRDLNRAMDWSLPDDAATTIAGLILHEAQVIPELGQSFVFHGFRLEVLRKSGNRIAQVKITPLEEDV